MRYRIFAIISLLVGCGAVFAAADEKAPAIDMILGDPLVALFLVVGLGLLAGKIRIAGISLGSSAGIFVALVFGAFGYHIPANAGNVGLILFVYCVGIAAGPGFFRAFIEQGADLAKLSVLLVALGALTVTVLSWLAGLPPELAAGLFGGALTSTPALAAAMDAAPDPAIVSIGYGIAYPFGVIGVVLFVQLLPRLVRADLVEESRLYGMIAQGRRSIERVLIEVTNPGVFGKKIHEVHFLKHSRCLISRVMRQDRLDPVSPDTVFEEGQLVLAVGDDDRIGDVVDFLGRRSKKRYVLDMETERMRVVVSSPEMVGKSLRNLNLLTRFGITISRIIRNDIEFVPDADTNIFKSDVLVSVGEADALKRFAACAGHRARALDETDVISLTMGITAGLMLGMIPIGLPGGRSFSLGLAGGPLLAGLVLGHFGHIGAIRGHIPRAARLLMTEIGLVFFLAGAGIQAGGHFLEVVRQYGPILFGIGALTTLIPLVVGYFFARRVLKITLLQTLGGVCGRMTSPPGLGVLTSKTDSEVPAVSYATAYPVALILMTFFAQIVLSVLS